jgi:hypothetical protein
MTLGRRAVLSGVVLSEGRAASLAATFSNDDSAVSNPEREASMGLTSRRASKVVPWAIGITDSLGSGPDECFPSLHQPGTVSPLTGKARPRAPAPGDRHATDRARGRPFVSRQCLVVVERALAKLPGQSLVWVDDVDAGVEEIVDPDQAPPEVLEPCPVIEVISRAPVA